MSFKNYFPDVLKKYNIINYKIITDDLKPESPDQLRNVIFNIDDDCYYKISDHILNTENNPMHYFLNNAYFPNHLVVSYLENDMWIVKQTVPSGKLLFDIFKNNDDIIIENIIDEALKFVKWGLLETHRLFPESNEFLDFGHLDFKAENIIYDTKSNMFTQIDYEWRERPFRSKEQFLDDLYVSFEKTMWRLRFVFQKISVKEYIRLLDKSLKYIDKEII